MLDQPYDVLGLEVCCSHAPASEFLKLVGHQVEHALAITLGRVTAVAVALAQLLQFKVQVSHSPSLSTSSSCLSVALGYPYVVADQLSSGKCFCPSRTPERCGNYKGPGTLLPFCAEVIHLPPRQAAWRRWRFAVASRSIGLSHFPKARVRQAALRLTWPAWSGRGRSRCTVCGFGAR